MPIEPGDSWFSPKCIEVQPRGRCRGGRALNGRGALPGYRTQSNSECRNVKDRSETVGDKLHGQKGNSPDPPVRSPNDAMCERKWEHADSQDVGLEAATISKVRNSLLVEDPRADNERD
jgi:hypothetical protein